MPDVTRLQPGDPEEIDEYRVLSRLGAGGQGVVYLALTPSGERVAIKRLLAAFGDERTRRQFAKEVSAAQRVAPFCTAQVVDARLDTAMPYVVSEYIDGLSLYEQVRDHGPVTGVALQRLAIGTSTALTAIHSAGLVHRDLKPANVMLAVDGPRVIDFGVARDLSMETTMNSRVLGTPAFMAPEQLRGEQVGPAADLFAWASVIAYAATGRTLFEAPHVVAVIHRIAEGEPDLTGVPADLLPVLRRCLNKDPARRPTAQQALVELLGRPGADAKVSDPSPVLAEAVELVQAGGPGRIERWAEGRSERWAERWGQVRTAVRARVAALRAEGPMSLSAETVGLAGVAVLVLLVLVVWSAGVFSAPAGVGDARSSTDRTNRTSAPVQSGDAGPASSGTVDVERPLSSEAASATPDDQATGRFDQGFAKNPIPAQYRGSWVGSYQVADSEDQTRTVKIDSFDNEGTLVVAFVGLGCKATLHYLSSSARYLNLVAETSSDLTGACGDQASVSLRVTKAGELLMTWEAPAAKDSRITGVLRRA